MTKIVPHNKFKDFQEKYGAIPASDKNDHIIKSRMLQGMMLIVTMFSKTAVLSIL